MDNPVIRILIVDDHRIFRDGLVSMLKDDPKIQIAGSASNGTEALQLTEILKPDVVVLDLSMPGLGGLEFLKRQKNFERKPGIIVLSMHDELTFVKEAMDHGAKGYISKNDTDRQELCKAIAAVASGKTYLGHAIRSTLEEQENDKKSSKKYTLSENPGPEVLSKREVEVLKMMMQGMSNQEIADAGFVSIRTVETHKSNIMAKLSLKNTVELVKYAIRNRFFEI
jgi:two-component system, NarL family, response regulator DegU